MAEQRSPAWESKREFCSRFSRSEFPRSSCCWRHSEPHSPGETKPACFFGDFKRLGPLPRTVPIFIDKLGAFCCRLRS